MWIAAKLKLFSTFLGLSLLVVPLCSMAVVRAAPAPSGAVKSGITISPIQKEVTIGSGLIEAKTTVTIVNHSGSRLIGTIKLLDFKNLNDTGGLSFAQAGVSTDKYGLAKWMTLPNGDTINIADGQTVEVPVNIDNRSDLSPGGHYGAVVVTFGDVNALVSSRANFKQELVSLLFIKKLGGEKYGLNLDSITQLDKTKLGSPFSLRFSNTGNVYVTPRGYLLVTDKKGREIEKGIINSDSTLVLPGASRKSIVELQTISAPKSPGKYKVTAYYRYDERSDFSTKSIYISNAHISRLGSIIWISTGVILIFLLTKIHLFKKKSYRKRR